MLLRYYLIDPSAARRLFGFHSHLIGGLLPAFYGQKGTYKFGKCDDMQPLLAPENTYAAQQDYLCGTFLRKRLIATAGKATQPCRKLWAKT